MTKREKKLLKRMALAAFGLMVLANVMQARQWKKAPPVIGPAYPLEGPYPPGDADSVQSSQYGPAPAVEVR